MSKSAHHLQISVCISSCACVRISYHICSSRYLLRRGWPPRKSALPMLSIIFVFIIHICICICNCIRICILVVGGLGGPRAKMPFSCLHASSRPSFMPKAHHRANALGSQFEMLPSTFDQNLDKLILST